MRRADRHTAYRDGLAEVNGTLTVQRGGGLCQLSNLLCWMFLHTPLTLVERHGHCIKDFPEPPSDAPFGVDATVAEGWLDLRVRNDTDCTFQIAVSFHGDRICGSVYAERDWGLTYQVINQDLTYYRLGGAVYEEVDIVQRAQETSSGMWVSTRRMYRNRCRIGYPPPRRYGYNRERMKPMKPQKIAVLFGGRSPEYRVSLESAAGVLRHMDRDRFTPVMVGITPAGDWLKFSGSIEEIEAGSWLNSAACVPAALSPNPSDHALLAFHDGGVEKIPLQAVFPVLHGKNGEDGSVQGLCQLAGIPVVGCGVLASALCMDKDRAHRLVQAAGIAVPHSVALTRDFDREALPARCAELGYPLFVKPGRAGSSYGVSKVRQAADLQKAIREAFQYDEQVLVEQSISGFEVGCAVIGNRTLRTGGGRRNRTRRLQFFDFTEKYSLSTARIHVPARIPEEIAAEIQETAKKSTGSWAAPVSPGGSVPHRRKANCISRGEHHSRIHASQPVSPDDAGGRAPSGAGDHPSHCGELMRNALRAWITDYAKGDNLGGFWRLYRRRQHAKNRLTRNILTFLLNRAARRHGDTWETARSSKDSSPSLTACTAYIFPAMPESAPTAAFIKMSPSGKRTAKRRKSATIASSAPERWS